MMIVSRGKYEGVKKTDGIKILYQHQLGWRAEAAIRRINE